MSVARTTYLLHGGDPAPGDSAAVRQLVTELRRAVQSVGDATVLLRSVGNDRSMWTGGAAGAFSHRLGELLGRLDTAHSAYQGAADALDRWLRKLTDAQADAAAIVTRAHAAAHAAGIDGRLPAGPVPPALALLQHDRDQLESRARADARACAADLDAASRAVGHYAHSVWQHVSASIVADVLAIDHVLKGASEVLGVLALVTCWIPGVGEAFGTLALATTALLVASDAVLVVAHKQSWTELAGDGAGLVLGAAGRTGEKIFTATREAAQLDAAAGSARAVSAGFGARADQAAESWLAGEGEFAPVARWTSARAVAAQDRDLLSTLATDAHAGTALGAALRSVVADTLHPFATVSQDLRPSAADGFADALAGSYHPMPSLTEWLSTQPGAAVSLAPEAASDIHDFAEAVGGKRQAPGAGR